MSDLRFGDVAVVACGHVYTVEIQRPPYNFFTPGLVESLAETLEFLDTVDDCRAVVLCSSGKAFCAGADFQASSGAALFDRDSGGAADQLYRQAVRLFRTRKPIVTAVQGAAVGGGLGLALVGDFRVGCESTRFAANFVSLGVHAGFGISYVLPRLIGAQKAKLMLYTGRRVGPEEALAYGLLDELVDTDGLRDAAIELAAEIACAAPLAVESTRETMRQGMADAIEQQMVREFSEQVRLSATTDHAEGLLAVRERRPGDFHRR